MERNRVRAFRARNKPKSFRPKVCSTVLPGTQLPSLITSAVVSSLLSSLCCLGFCSVPFPLASCHRKAAGLRRKGKRIKSRAPRWSEEILRVYSIVCLFPNLLDRCFLPARWAVSMARVSRTGRWGQMAQAKLGSKKDNWSLGRESWS